MGQKKPYCRQRTCFLVLEFKECFGERLVYIHTYVHSYIILPLSRSLSVSRYIQHVCAQLYLFVTPWTVARQTLPVGFSRQEYWSGLPFPSPGDLSNPKVKPASLASPTLAGGLFTTVPLGKP